MQEVKKSNLVAYKVPRDKGGFTTIPNHIIMDNDLSCKAKTVYLYIESVSSIENWTLNIKSMCKAFKENESTVRKAVQELIDAGYLKRESKKDNFNRFSKFIFKFTEVKNQFIETLLCPEKKPVAEKPKVEKPNMEKIPPNNKHLKKTNTSKKQQTTKEKNLNSKISNFNKQKKESKKEGSVVASSKDLNINEKEIFNKLIKIGVTEATAIFLLNSFSHSDINIQIKALSFRKANNPAGYLVKSIKENWDLPPAMLKEVKEDKQKEKRSMISNFCRQIGLQGEDSIDKIKNHLYSLKASVYENKDQKIQDIYNGLRKNFELFSKDNPKYHLTEDKLHELNLKAINQATFQENQARTKLDKVLDFLNYSEDHNKNNINNIINQAISKISSINNINNSIAVGV